MADDTQMTRHVNAPAMQRVADAWAMRIRGAGWEEVARALGYANPQNAMRAVRNYVGRLPEPQMPELRSMWRERLEALWPIATRDVEAGKPGAMRAAVAVAQRAAQLDGLDAPTRVHVEGSPDLQAMARAILQAQGDEITLEASVWDDDDEVADE